MSEQIRQFRCEYGIKSTADSGCQDGGSWFYYQDDGQGPMDIICDSHKKEMIVAGCNPKHSRKSNPHTRTNLRIVVFDLEIKNTIDGKNITWNDHHKMGVSVGCAYDYEAGEYKVFMDDNLGELVDLLNNADLVVAFNNLAFDNPLLRATAKNLGLQELKPDSELHNYDMLVESRAGAKVDKYAKGFNLDSHLTNTFGSKFVKTANGADAPGFWQTGKLGKLVSYCLADVHRERLLFEHIWKNRSVKVSPTAHQVRYPGLVHGMKMSMSLDQVSGLSLDACKKQSEDLELSF